VHLVGTQDDPSQAFRQSIERLWMADRRLERLAEDAFWPRASPDGSWLAYVTINPLDFSNNLLLARPDATEARSAVPPGLLPYMDSPVFSLDSEWLYFSAVGTGLSKSPGFLAQAFGVFSAEAHSLPSDWWRVPVQGGSPERLTELGQSNLIGAASPDGLHLAFLSSTGLYAMNLDGSQITAMLNTWSSGGLDWIP
jgi:Tol biopolymer transport system component